VRSAVGPSTKGGLEVVRIADSTGRDGIALVRWRTPFAPFGLGDVSANQLNFTDPVVLPRAVPGFVFLFVRRWIVVGHLAKCRQLPLSDFWLATRRQDGRSPCQPRRWFTSSCRRIAPAGGPGLAVRNPPLMPTVRDLPLTPTVRRLPLSRCSAMLHSITRAVLFA
jgi:hypothetical protein